MYTIQNTLYTLHNTLYTIPYTVYNIQYTLYTIHYKLTTIQCTQFTIHYTVSTIQYKLWKGQFELIFHARLLKTNRFNSLSPNHSEKLFWGKIFIFMKVIFFDPFEIGVLGLTWRIRLLEGCNMKTLHSQITCV